MATISSRLQSSRARRFVGREAELALFGQALNDPEAGFAVLFVHGPPGVGKSALLQQLGALAERAGRRTVLLDLREVTLTPDGVDAALTESAGGTLPDVLLVDTYEVALALDGWVRDQLVPSLPSGTLVVIAGRASPATGWTADPGWRSLVRVVSLRNLDRADAERLLVAAAIQPEDRERILDETFGHPLALAVYIDLLSQRPEVPRDRGLLDAPDVVRSLLDRFVNEVPTARHRAALELCAHVRFTSQELVRLGLGVDDAAATELFDWLRRLSFVDVAREGVFPHDLARDILDSDLRWRDTAAYERLHRRVRAHLVSLVRSTRGERRTRATVDLVFLHRANPVMRPFWDFSRLNQGYLDRLRPGDEAALAAMVEAHQGPESAAVLAHWLNRQPEAFAIFRVGASPLAQGFTALLALHQATADDFAVDPAARAMWAFTQSEGGASPGQSIVACRWIMDRESHHAPGSLGLGLSSVEHLQHILTNSARAFDFIGGIARPEEVDPVFSYIDFRRQPALEYDLDGRRWHCYAMDWRRRDVDTWFSMIADRELGAPIEPSSVESDTTIALSRADFADAVRVALREVNRPDRLRQSPLLRSRLLHGRPGDPAQALSELVRRSVEDLREDERTEKYHRVLDRTFLRPAPTQERAAEVLDLPFSTYRRHLARGVDAVVAALWDRELFDVSPNDLENRQLTG